MPEPHRVDSNLIVVLDAILKEKNLTRAGELIGMTQPAVSGALARLRQQYDDPLLLRTGRSYELTPLAEALVPVVSEAMTEIMRTLEVLPTFDPETSTRTFLVSASDYVLSVMTSPLLHLLGESAPGTRVSFESLPTEQMVSPNDLLRRDVVITGAGFGAPGKRQSLFSDRFVCIVDARNPRLRDGRISLTDLAELRHVMSSFGELVSTPVDDMLSAGGVSPKVGVTVQGFLPVPATVSGTTMIAHVPERIALRYGDALGLVIADTPLQPSVLVEAAHWHPSKTEDPALQWLVGMMRRAAELVEFEGEDWHTGDDTPS